MRVRKHANPFNFSKDKEIIQLEKVFVTPENPLTFEIGFAHGEYLLERAKNEANRNFIGFEVREQLVEKVRITAEKEDLKNIFVANASSLVNIAILPNDSISEVIAFFCDPCFKTKHHKRRIINPKFLNEIKPKLKKDNILYFQTDVLELYSATLSYIKEDKEYSVLQEEIVTGVPNKTGSTSFFEQRCLDNNWPIHRIMFNCLTV
jgi:tRNA (guanine-N7-)-methyltransferase